MKRLGEGLLTNKDHRWCGNCKKYRNHKCKYLRTRICHITDGYRNWVKK
jgi:hypothetical protein